MKLTKNQTAHRTRIRILLMVVLLLFMAISCYDFALQAFGGARVANDVRLREMAAKTAQSVRIKLESSQEYIQSAARAFGAFENVHSPEAIGQLGEMNQESPFSRLWLITPDGLGVSNLGDVGRSPITSDLEKALAGQSGISDVMSPGEPQGKVVTIYAPVYRQGQVVAALSGVYQLRDLSRELELKSFEGQGECCVFQPDGQLVLTSRAEDQEQMDTNLYQRLEGADFQSGDSYQEFCRKAAAQQSGTFSASIGATRRFFAYSPLGVSDWTIMTVVPRQVVLQHMEPMAMAAVFLFAKLVAAFLLFLAGGIHLEKEARRRIAGEYRDLACLSDNLPGGVQKCTADETGELFYVSKGYLKMLGISEEELRTRFENRFINTVARVDRDRVREELRCFAALREDLSLRYRLNTQDGRTVWVSHQGHLAAEEGRDYYYCSILDITETKKAEDALRISMEQYRIAISQTNQVIFEYDPATHRVTYPENSNAQMMIGRTAEYAPEDVLASGALASPESEKNYVEAYHKICNGADCASCEVRIRLRDRQEVWQKISLTNIFDEQGSPIKAMGIVQDITREKEAERKLRQEENYRSAILGETIFVYEFDLSTPGATSLYASPKLSADYEEFSRYVYSPENLERLHPDDQAAVAELFSVVNLWKVYYSRSGEIRHQCRIKNKEGNWSWVECTLHFIEDVVSRDVIAIIYVKSIDEQKQKELALRSRAERDPLTGLYHRAAAQERIDAVLEQPMAQGQYHALLILDIDHFKAVNDTYGHMTGDQLICQMAKLLNTQFRKTDILARLGGDEFIVFLSGLTSPERAGQKAQELCREVLRLGCDPCRPLAVSVSVGISVAPTDGQSFTTLYSRADVALYHAKERGRNQYCLYSDDDAEALPPA